MFTVTFAHPKLREQAYSGDLYNTALSYIRGEIDVAGDIVDAVRFFENRARHGWRQIWHRLFARLGPWRFESWWQSRARATGNIRRHYDLSNDFYSQFLDPGMTYSCAYFEDPEWDIGRAQQAKLDLILRKLDLQPGERFLDIGCGWGSLVDAAANRGAVATGCTLSPAQHEFAAQRLAGRAAVLRSDYRDLAGQWDKISSVGMFEHVGRRRLPAYFHKVRGLLAPEGLFLNHGIVRPRTGREDVETLFLRRMVFPGTELPYLDELIRASEDAGFEVLDVESLRPHYALTCRAWVERLRQNEEACVRATSGETVRTWVLYLAGCSLQFETSSMDVCQTVLARRAAPRRHMTRDYMYKGTSRIYG